MNLLNLIEDITTGHDNLRALMQAGQSGQDAVLNIGGETVTLDPMEARWMFSKYKAFNKAGRQEEFLNHLADPVKFDQHMKQLRDLIDKQKNFQGSVPGQRGVEGDTYPGQMEEAEAVEEIAQQDPNNMTPQTRGKLNWENMIKDYMGNKPYTEFEFSNDRPLTVYRTQVYAILKAFGSMKPQNKVNTILNTFGDKMATVEYLDKLRAKGLMPKKVPAYVPPGTEPVPPGQMSLPGMDTPKIKEAQAQKKNSEVTDRKNLVNPRVARAFQLARARQTAAGSDIEAFVQDELEKQTQTDQTIKDLEAVNRRQDAALKKAQVLDLRQGNDISDIETQLDRLSQKLQVIKTAKPAASQSPAAQPATPDTAPAPQQPTAAEPQAPVAQPDIQQQPSDVAEPTVAKKKPAARKKASTTKVSKPRKTSKPAPTPTPDNVLQFPQGGRRGQASDEVAAALQGVDMSDELATGTFGLKEAADELQVGDPVIIQGNVEFKDKTGDVVEFGRDKNFVIVDLYNFGKHAFHASNVRYNDYADQEDYVDEGRMKDLAIGGQTMPSTRSGNYVVIQKKQDTVVPIRQHPDSLSAQKHAQAIKNKYPGMQIGIQSPEGTVKYIGIKEAQTSINRFSIAQPPAGGTNKQREEFLNARDRLFRQMQSASPGEKEAIRLKIADLEGQAQSQGVKIRETEDLNRSGYNAIKSLSDWAEKMNAMRELQKDIALMSDPESKAAVQQRIGDLLKIGIKQGYVKEALSDRAMAVLRGLQQPTQPAPVAVDLNVPEPTSEPQMDLATAKKRIAQLDELIRMKEQIDRLFVRAQNARGGIYPGLQSDIEDEELYGVPQSDKEYEILKDKYTKDLAALQKFIAMKKAVYREGREIVGESSALVRLKQARQALSQGKGQLNELDLFDKRKTYFKMGNGQWIVSNYRNLGSLNGPAYDQQFFRSLQWLTPSVAQALGLDVKLANKGPIGSNVYDFTKPTQLSHWNVNHDLIDAVQDWVVKNPPSATAPNQQGMAEGKPRAVDAQGNPVDWTKTYPVDDSNKTKASTPGSYSTSKGVVTKTPTGLIHMARSSPPKPNPVEGVAEAQTDYQKRRQRERDVDAGKPVSRQPKNPQNDYFARRKKEKKHDMDEAISKKDLLSRLQKDLPKVNDPKNKDAKPVVWTGPGKDDCGYTGYQGHGMPTDKQERDRIRADKKKGVAEGLKPGEYHIHTVYFKDGTKKRVRVTSDEVNVADYYNKRGQAVDRVDYDFQIHSNMTEQLAMPGTTIPLKSVIQGYTVFYNPQTREISVTRGGDNAEAAIEQAQLNTPSVKAFRQAVDRMIDKIETESINEETQDDRNARIIAGEIEDAMAQGKEEVVKQKIKQLINVGYTLDKNGKLQRMGMYEDQALQEEQDACYRKVKARYKVWPSAYASGALVQCRKKGAANWGEGGKKK